MDTDVCFVYEKKEKKMKKLVSILLITILAIALFACAPSDVPAETGQSQEPVAATQEPASTAEAADGNEDFVVEWEGVTQPAWFEQPTQTQIEIAQMDEVDQVNCTPYVEGIEEESVDASAIELTEDQIAQVQQAGLKAAICMHSMSFDWPQQQVEGLKTEFEKMGIEVISVADSNYNDADQMAQVRAAITAGADIIVSLPVDPQTTQIAFQEASEAGVKLVFMSQAPNGMKAGEDYVSVVVPDDFGNGIVSADLMAEAIGGSGEVAAVYYATDYDTTNLRYLGFVTRLKAKYPDIALVEAQGFAHQDDTQGIGNALFTKYPELDAIWVAWSVPAMGVVASARLANLQPQDCYIITEDLDNDSALSIAEQSYIYGLGTQFPYDMGITEARLAALACIGESVPPLISYANMKVDRSNLLEAYDAVWHVDPPAEIVAAMEE
ncbi:hypothetical protein CE91St36_03390 [Christensenellaceae bacterium]|nr:hypothetical protein CE91St36_03390 [Christensenellaceae bacterium]BDF60190.1 hypothetical protein CE91St37_03400 [Christensenellaceae bacterium]